MDVTTDHQIVAFGDDKMVLFNSADGQVLVNAERPAGQATWTVSATGVSDVAASNRSDAITAMVNQAIAAYPSSGYSTLVPHTLSQMP